MSSNGSYKHPALSLSIRGVRASALTRKRFSSYHFETASRQHCPCPVVTEYLKGRQMDGFSMNILPFPWDHLISLGIINFMPSFGSGKHWHWPFRSMIAGHQWRVSILYTLLVVAAESFSFPTAIIWNFGETEVPSFSHEPIESKGAQIWTLCHVSKHKNEIGLECNNLDGIIDLLLLYKDIQVISWAQNLIANLAKWLRWRRKKIEGCLIELSTTMTSTILLLEPEANLVESCKCVTRRLWYMPFCFLCCSSKAVYNNYFQKDLLQCLVLDGSSMASTRIKMRRSTLCCQDRELLLVRFNVVFHLEVFPYVWE